MITLRIIDTNNNNYFPQKIENFSFKNIHYGGNSELNFKLNENPSFQNHKVGLFNNIYLYNFSTLIWSGYITEFRRDYINLNYNLKASGLLIDFKNKRIKKTYVLDDIGEFRNWSERNNKEVSEIFYGYSQEKDDKGIRISILQRNYVAEEDAVFEIKVDNNIERLKAKLFILQPSQFTTKLVTLNENHSNPTIEWQSVGGRMDTDLFLDITSAVINKRYLQFRVECTGAKAVTDNRLFSQLENLKLLTSDDEINAANILKDLLANHTQKLDLDTTLIQDCFNFKDIELCESLEGWTSRDLDKASLSLENTIIKEGDYSIKSIVQAGSLGMFLRKALSKEHIYSFDFSSDDGNWTLNNALIQNGVLDITANEGYGQRSPDSDWGNAKDTEFVIEVDFKQDNADVQGIRIDIYLVGDAVPITCVVNGVANTMNIYYGVSKASRAFVDDVAWHSAKIRRVGTRYYFGIDGNEINWSYGIERKINYLSLRFATQGEYDNFVYSWKEMSPQNLQDKNLFRVWFYSTITGNILKAKFSENTRYQHEPDWTIKYEADQEPPAADPVWTLVGTDYGSVADGIFTINKVAANACLYRNADVGHNVKGNTILAKVKVTNAAKTTYLSIFDGIARIELAIYTTKIEDWNDPANTCAIDMTDYHELWLTMKNNFWVLYIDGNFVLEGETQTTASTYFSFGVDNSANLGQALWDYVYCYNLGFLRNKRIEKIINITGNIYEFDFASDDGKWILDNAIITGGVLDIIANGGWGQRYPDANWLSGATDDFEIEVDFQQNATSNYGMEIMIKLVGESGQFIFRLEGINDLMVIRFAGLLKASQAFVDDTVLHTAKIRRVGTTFYFSIDAGSEISWDYETARELNYFRLRMIECTGDFDDFKYSYKDAWQEIIIDLNNFPIETRDAIKYIQFEVLTNDAFTFYIDQIRSNFELTSAYYRDRTAPLNILESVLAYQDYEWTITKNRKVKFFEVDRNAIDYICPIKNLVFEENSASYFSKIYLVYFDEMMQRKEIELTDEDSKIPFVREHVIGLGGISDTGAKAIGEEQFSFHKKPRYQLDCLVDNFVFDKNGGRINPIEIEPNNNIRFLGISRLPIFRIIQTDYANDVCRLTLETYPESTPNIMKSIIEVL